MLFLKRNNFISLCLSLSLSLIIGGCTTSSYRINNHDKSRYELLVSPDRILLECESIADYSDPGEKPYGFMIHVLDEKNTVLTVNQGNLLDKASCYQRTSKIGQILKDGRRIFIGGIGNLDLPRTENTEQYLFSSLGRFSSNGRVLQFMAIWNEKGQCYSAYNGDKRPCPSDEFPIGSAPH